MDEPLSNLDAKLRAQTRLELVDLHRRVETTVVYVTHDQVEAMTMADRIAIMSAGRLQQVGTPQEVYEAPANLFVAQFIGTPPMNTMPGTVVTDARADRGRAVDVGGGRVPLPPGLASAAGRGPAGGRRRAARAPGHRPRDGPLEQKVRAVEWLGHECLVFGSIGEAPVVVRQSGHGPARRRRHGPAGGRSRRRPPVRPRHHRAAGVTAGRWPRRRPSPVAAGARYSPRERRGLALAAAGAVDRRVRAFFYRPFLNLVHWGTFESRRNGAFFEDVGLSSTASSSPATTSARACGTASSSCSTRCRPA